jgi:hypothetical protein
VGGGWGVVVWVAGDAAGGRGSSRGMSAGV